LASIQALDKPLHQLLQPDDRRIITTFAFSHSQGHMRVLLLSQFDVRSRRNSGHAECRHPSTSPQLLGLHLRKDQARHFRQRPTGTARANSVVRLMEKLARLIGKSSNRVFESLAGWNAALEALTPEISRIPTVSP